MLDNHCWSQMIAVHALLNAKPLLLISGEVIITNNWFQLTKCNSSLLKVISMYISNWMKSMNYFNSLTPLSIVDCNMYNRTVGDLNYSQIILSSNIIRLCKNNPYDFWKKRITSLLKCAIYIIQNTSHRVKQMLRIQREMCCL